MAQPAYQMKKNQYPLNHLAGERKNISQQNISSYTITVDGDVKTLPFEVSYGQTLEINITKLDVATTAYLTLMGNTK